MIPSRTTKSPKITVELSKTGEVISERNRWYIYAPNGELCSVEQTMDDHHKKIPDFSTELQNIPMSSLILIVRMQPGVRILPTSGLHDGFVYSDQCYGFIFPENHSLTLSQKHWKYPAIDTINLIDR